MTQQKKYLEDFTDRKKKSISLAQSYERIFKMYDQQQKILLKNKYQKKYFNTLECGNFLEFKEYENGETDLFHANFCKDRLCPQCAKRRSLKIFAQLSEVMEELKKDDFRFIFITLTIKNCKYDKLSETIDILNDGYRKFYRLRGLFRAKNPKFYGVFKSIEFTRNTVTHEWHPHLHLLVAVKEDYFKSMVWQRDLADIWAECIGIDYFVQVNIKAVKKDNSKKVKCELSKYITKSKDYILTDDKKLTDYLVESLSVQLFNKRFISYQGVFFKVRQKLKLKDIDEDLVNIESLNKNSELSYIIKKYRWNIGLTEYEEF